MTTIINTFSNCKYLKVIPYTDRLIWIASVLQYKALGCKVKLYCTKNDIQFLKDNYLYDLYDEIDDECFDNTDYLNNGTIDDSKFWFIRKLAAINNEFQIGNKDFMYSDVDVVLFEFPKDLADYDVYGWCLEKPLASSMDPGRVIKSIYCDWSLLSQPENYKPLDCVVNTKTDIINGGLLYFKSKEFFECYQKHVLDFVVNNPGVVADRDLEAKGSVLACNAEQRILTALANYYELSIGVFDHSPDYQAGVTPQGCHYFICRVIWRENLKDYQPNNITMILSSAEIYIFLQKLIDIIMFAFELLQKYNYTEAANYYYSIPYINHIVNLNRNMIHAFLDYEKQFIKDE